MNLLHFDFSNLRQVFLQAIVIVCFGIATGLMFNYPVLLQAFDDNTSIEEPSSVVPDSGGPLKGQP